MVITIGNVLTVRDPTERVLRWVKDNLEIPNPEYAKKMRMGFWVGNTPKVIRLYEVRDRDYLIPFGCLKDIYQISPADSVWNSAMSGGFEVQFGGEDVPLYKYQSKAVNAVFAAQYGILQSPAGSGKTQMGIALIKKYGKRALWLTHTLDLLKQSKARAEQYIDHDVIGTITEGKVQIGSGITFATVQTMSRMDLTPYRDYWDVIVTDEVHRVAGSPTSVTMFYKVLSSLAARHKIGLSATVHRSDGMIRACYALVGDVVYVVPDADVKDKIMQVGILPVNTGTRISMECLNTDGTLNYSKLITYLTKDEDRNRLIVDCLIENLGRSCLILSDRLDHLRTLMGMLPDKLRKDARMIDGKMVSKKGKAERLQAIEDMRSGKIRYLFATYSLAKEGLDIPCLERLFMVTPQKDYAVITQSIGRIARTCDGKDDPVAYDFVDDIGYLVKSYKKRCATYRKNNCYFVEVA